MDEIQVGRKFSNGELTLSGQHIAEAEAVGKEHKNIVRDIRNILNQLEQGSRLRDARMIISHLIENPILGCVIYLKESYYLNFGTKIKLEVLQMNEMQLGRKFGNGEVVMSSLDIVELTGKRHADVMRDIRVEVSNLGEELGRRIFSQSYYMNKQNKKQPCYEFSKKGAMQLALKYDAMTRFKVIEYIEMLESELKPKLPTTYRDALAELLRQVDENERLALENEKMKPKAQFAEAVEISTNSVSVGHVAKIACKEGLNIGQNKLFAWLRDNGYLIKRPGTAKNTPTQRSMDLGVMELVASTKEVNGESKTFYTTKITGKGQVYFVNKLLEEYEQ